MVLVGVLFTITCGAAMIGLEKRHSLAPRYVLVMKDEDLHFPIILKASILQYGHHGGSLINMEPH